MQQLQERRVVLISQDSFYRGLNQEELKGVKEYNFDHPNAMDQEAILKAPDPPSALLMTTMQYFIFSEIFFYFILFASHPLLLTTAPADRSVASNSA